MTLAHETTLYDIADLMVFPMLTDASNASPTYGTKVDVPGVSAVSLDPSIVANALKGDGKTIARRARIDELQFKATYGKVALGVLSTVLGFSAAADSGSTPNQVATSLLTLPKAIPPFGLRFVIDDADVGIDGLVVTMYKAQITGGTFIDTKADAFSEPTLEASAYAPNHATDLNGTAFVDFTPTIKVDMYETLPALTTMP